MMTKLRNHHLLVSECFPEKLTRSRPDRCSKNGCEIKSLKASCFFCDGLCCQWCFTYEIKSMFVWIWSKERRFIHHSRRVNHRGMHHSGPGLEASPIGKNLPQGRKMYSNKVIHSTLKHNQCFSYHPHMVFSENHSTKPIVPETTFPKQMLHKTDSHMPEQNGFPYARISNNECHHRSSMKTMSWMSIFPHPLSMWDSSIQYRISYCTYSLFQNMPYNQLLSSNPSWWQSPELYNEFNVVETQSVSAPPEWPWY